MKKFSFIIAATLMLFSSHAFAGDKYTKEMLKQVADVNSSWKPIIGTNKYTIKREHDTVYILLFYNTYRHTSTGFLDEADPEVDDIRVVFQVKDNKCRLLFVDEYAGLDLIKQHIDILVP